MTRARSAESVMRAAGGAMAESDSRASARRHTAQLLKMLRGHESEPGLSPASPAWPATSIGSEPDGAVRITPIAPSVIAEIPAPYRPLPPLPTMAPDRPAPRAPSVPAIQEAPPRQRASSIPTVGESLRHPQGTLGRLMARADRLNRLNHVFRAYLPPHLHDHVVLVRLDQDDWTVHADSSSWATRLRYALHNIRDTLGQQLGIPLPKPRVRVVPPDFPPRPRRPRLTLTQRNAKLLE
ncbi:MAG: DciA family protein, partial [Candidatus Competibacter phosphatis]